MIISLRGLLPPVMLVGSNMPVTVNDLARLSNTDQAAFAYPASNGSCSRNSVLVAPEAPEVVNPSVGATQTIRSSASRNRNSLEYVSNSGWSICSASPSPESAGVVRCHDFRSNTCPGGSPASTTVRTRSSESSPNSVVTVKRSVYWPRTIGSYDTVFPVALAPTSAGPSTIDQLVTTFVPPLASYVPVRSNTSPETTWASEPAFATGGSPSSSGGVQVPAGTRILNDTHCSVIPLDVY